MIAAIVIGAGLVLVDRVYISGLKKELLSLEKQRIATANQLATAKIVQENLNHVRELVFENMEFAGRVDSVAPESRLFEFITTCVSDLKLKLVSLKPVSPETRGAVTVYGYNLEVEGDFFSFGELCSKFENSRRIIALENFKISLMNEYGGIQAKMLVNTFRIKKQ